jgi:hypothetical protein
MRVQRQIIDQIFMTPSERLSIVSAIHSDSELDPVFEEYLIASCRNGLAEEQEDAFFHLWERDLGGEVMSIVEAERLEALRYQYFSHHRCIEGAIVESQRQAQGLQ